MRSPSPAHRHKGWSTGCYHHHSHCAAVCRVVPFRLWASRGEPSESKGLWGFCGARRGADGLGDCIGRGIWGNRPQLAAIESGQESSRKVKKCRAPVPLAERRSPTRCVSADNL
jgi:hypothetical protein